jgi:hypothetical protein
VVRGPSLFRLLFKFRSELLDLRPCLLAILQEQSCIKLDAAVDLNLCGFTMLAANLDGALEC